MVTARQASRVQTEEADFGMHPKLLMDVIQKQAGTLAKAILEGVMNSIDAGCKSCAITLGSQSVLIVDDGSGITDKASIKKFWATFGQPHEDHERKTYGTFRMGRGQMFAYGHNTWRTGPFEMVADVAKRGTRYVLKSGLDDHPGCRIYIRLYTDLMPTELAETERLLREWVKYAPARVTLNGKQINLDPRKEEWDHVLPEAYIKLTRGSALKVYNLGVHTMDIAGYRFGVGGVVVSRRQLKVNFARNDVMSDCAVWQAVKPFIDQKAQKEIVKKPSLNDAERQRLADLLTQGDRPPGCEGLRVFTAVNGRHYSAQQLWREARVYRSRITRCRQGNRVGDKIFQQKLAFVLAEETLERFGVKKVTPVIDLVESIYAESVRYERERRPDWRLYKVIKFEALAKVINDRYDLVPEDKLTAIERVWLSVASAGYGCFVRLDGDGLDDRRVLVGDAEHADGWTDGKTFVAVNRRFLKNLPFDARGAARLAALLLHERCHDGPDTAEHTHGQEFYEEYHNRSLFELPNCVERVLHMLPGAFTRAGKQVTKACLAHADQVETIYRGLRETFLAAKKAKEKAAEPEE